MWYAHTLKCKKLKPLNPLTHLFGPILFPKHRACSLRADWGERHEFYNLYRLNVRKPARVHDDTEYIVKAWQSRLREADKQRKPYIRCVDGVSFFTAYQAVFIFVIDAFRFRDYTLLLKRCPWPLAARANSRINSCIKEIIIIQQDLCIRCIYFILHVHELLDCIILRFNFGLQPL